jgi:hypothetical protein
MGFLFDNSSFGNYRWRKPEGELYLALHREDLIRYKNIVRCPMYPSSLADDMLCGPYKRTIPFVARRLGQNPTLISL